MIARYIAFRTNRYPVRTLYASPPPHIGPRRANFKFTPRSPSLPPPPPTPPPPPWQKPESSKHRAPLPCPTNLPPLSLGGAITLFLVPFDRSFRSLEYIPPRDFFHQHSFTPVRYTYNEEVHRDRTRVGATERLSFLSASP